MRVIFDTREPWPHPWAAYLLEGWELERGTLETGDIALAALPEGAIIERKTPAGIWPAALAQAGNASRRN